MKTGNVTFQYELHASETPEVRRRRDVLLKALPSIEKSYAHVLQQRKLAAFDKSPRVKDEALKFYNEVIADGRYIGSLEKDPGHAAKQLGVQVSAEALSLVQSLISELRGPGGNVEGPVEAVIAIAVVIACAAPSPEEPFVVIDSSARVSTKL